MFKLKTSSPSWDGIQRGVGEKIITADMNGKDRETIVVCLPAPFSFYQIKPFLARLLKTSFKQTQQTSKKIAKTRARRFASKSWCILMYLKSTTSRCVIRSRPLSNWQGKYKSRASWRLKFHLAFPQLVEIRYRLLGCNLRAR